MDAMYSICLVCVCVAGALGGLRGLTPMSQMLTYVGVHVIANQVTYSAHSSLCGDLGDRLPPLLWFTRSAPHCPLLSCLLQVGVGGCYHAFDEEGRLVSEKSQVMLRDAVAQLVTLSTDKANRAATDAVVRGLHAQYGHIELHHRRLRTVDEFCE
jgi:hypothetical protein